MCNIDSFKPEDVQWVPIGEFRPEDVFVVAYPKSGITWFQHMAAGVVFGVDPEYSPDTLIQELVPDVHYKRYYKRFRTPTFFKSHELPRSEYRRVVYLLRDGRDAMVSYFYFLTVMQGPQVKFLTLVREQEGLFPCRWHEHVDAWLSNPFRADLLVVKYEDLVHDAENQLRRFSEFVRIEREASYLARVARNASFEKMRQKELRQGWDNPAWPNHQPFVRRGKIGSYLDEMPPDVLDSFMEYSGETLRRCGYAVEGREASEG